MSPAFLPLVQQIALQSSERGLGSQGYTVGQPVPAGPVLPRDQTLTVTLPDGSTQAVLIGEKPNLLDAVNASGFYQVGSGGKDGTLLTFPVNVDPRESDLTPITEDALGKIALHESVAGVDNLRRWLSQSRGMLPLWPTLLALAALAFAVESVWSNLAARKRAQGEETHIKTGTAEQAESGESVPRPGGGSGGGGGMTKIPDLRRSSAFFLCHLERSANEAEGPSGVSLQPPPTLPTGGRRGPSTALVRRSAQDDRVFCRGGAGLKQYVRSMNDLLFHPGVVVAVARRGDRGDRCA